ncbi:MAG: DUF3341 domain-containing protein [Bryobacteraceae bacterium]
MSGEATHTGPEVYGLLAEFESAGDLLKATRKTYEAGYRKLDAYSPFPVEELWEAVGPHSNHVPLAVLCGGIAGMAAGFGLQAYTAMMYYPMNVGGRPNLSWPSFIPITFELSILFASFAATFGMILMNGLPRPHHPLFNVERFSAMASRDRFFLCIEAKDPKFHQEETKKFLASLEPREVTEVAE